MGYQNGYAVFLDYLLVVDLINCETKLQRILLKDKKRYWPRPIEAWSHYGKNGRFPIGMYLINKVVQRV